MRAQLVRSIHVLLMCMACCLSTWAQAQAPVFNSEKHAFRVTTLVTGLENPWSIAFLPDGRMLVTERAGRLRLVSQDHKLDPKPIDGLPEVIAQGQGGLFDVVLHPQYAQNGWIYWAYNAPGPGGWGTALARGKLQDHRMTEVQVLFSMQPKTRSSFHFGGRIVFDQAGFVYLTLGDRGDKDRAQKMNDHAGSVIRLHDDGRVPANNPFVNRAGALAEKWTLGNRNMQGAALHPQTGELWTHEHGPQGGDEVNVMRSGLNYGWPVISYGMNYNGTPLTGITQKDGMEQPLVQWTPSIAACGLTCYTGEKFPNWKYDFFAGGLRGELHRIRIQNGKAIADETLLSGLGRVRDVRSGPDGFLYIILNQPDRIVRVVPAE